MVICSNKTKSKSVVREVFKGIENDLLLSNFHNESYYKEYLLDLGNKKKIVVL